MTKRAHPPPPGATGAPEDGLVANGGGIAKGKGPRRYIYTQADMEQFRRSSARKELLNFATALGRSCAAGGTSKSTPPVGGSDDGKAEGGGGGGRYRYDPADPLVGLSPALASVHGSLRNMAETWLADMPPDKAARARFGNPAFKTWHARLVERTEAIVRCALDCHRARVLEPRRRRQKAAAEAKGEKTRPRDEAGEVADADRTTVAAAEEEVDSAGTANTVEEEEEEIFSRDVLRACSDAGYAAASDTPNPPLAAVALSAEDAEREADIVDDLRAYLHPAFGHPVRLDYGTGHESSFLTFLFGLTKLGCLGNATKDAAPPPSALAPVALSIFSAYLTVTRGLQKDYMLEPAGSHGVWGLDDYHCLPFYFGACQLQDDDSEENKDVTPRSINDVRTLEARGDDLMYLGCIRYVRELKPGAPFFESSPMLDDISHLSNWGRVARGLLRLYEGEVLDKLPVVQHFEFGTLFKATWTPSQLPREAPTHTFINGPGGDECIAPWAATGGGGAGPGGPGESVGGVPPPPTKAPWLANSPTGGGAGKAGGGGVPPSTRAPWAK